MTGIAKALDEATLADVAAYYAAQPQRNPNVTTLAGSPRAIVRLVELGDPAATFRPARRVIASDRAALLRLPSLPSKDGITPSGS
jgi:hypothetical protein